MTTRHLGEEGARWFMGTVEDIMDPEKLGRVRVRVYHEYSSSKISTDDIPWAYVFISPTSAGMGQVGRSPTGLLVGSVVLGLFLDGNEKQIPIVLGSYAKLPGKDQRNNDISGLAREINTLSKTQDGPEPASAYAAKYPYNHVTQSESGHVLEMDDTPSAERLHVYHKSGTYTEINKDGRQVSKVVDDSVAVVLKDKSDYVKGNHTVQINGAYDETINSDKTSTVSGTAGYTASQFNFTGPTNISGHTNIGADLNVNSNETIGGNLYIGGTINSAPGGSGPGGGSSRSVISGGTF